MNQEPLDILVSQAVPAYLFNDSLSSEDNRTTIVSKHRIWMEWNAAKLLISSFGNLYMPIVFFRFIWINISWKKAIELLIENSQHLYTKIKQHFDLNKFKFIIFLTLYTFKSPISAIILSCIVIAKAICRQTFHQYLRRYCGQCPGDWNYIICLLYSSQRGV